ncbi:MAG: hypothetical protein ACFE9Z_06125 [Promethearchaeota archaeon]
MKRKYFVLVLLLISLGVSIIVKPVKGFYYNLIYLEVNEDVLYFDEEIKINASWELNYNTDNEEAYVQIHILDEFDDFIWNSSRFYNIGSYEENWTINIEDLNLDFKNSSFIINIKFFLFYYHLENMNTIRTYLETKKIRIIKRNVSCQLIDYRDHIKVGEVLSFEASFFDDTSDYTKYLSNHSINFKVSFNDMIIHQSNYTTNNLGIISLQLSSLTNLNLGQNILIFSIENNPIFNDSNFYFNMFVEKSQLNFEVINFKINLKESEELKGEFYCFYIFNQTEIPLINYNLFVRISNNNSIIYNQEYSTDEFGVLYINIPQESFFSTQNSHELILSIIFNGSDLLENTVLNLTFNIIQDPFSKLFNSFQMKFLSFSSILIIIFIIFSYLILNKKNKSEKLLSELVIRY